MGVLLIQSEGVGVGVGGGVEYSPVGNRNTKGSSVNMPCARVTDKRNNTWSKDHTCIRNHTSPIDHTSPAGR